MFAAPLYGFWLYCETQACIWEFWSHLAYSIADDFQASLNKRPDLTVIPGGRTSLG